MAASNETAKAQGAEVEEQDLEGGFDITGLLLDLLSNWKWFLLSIVIMLAGAYYYVATIIPTYVVNASIALSDETTEAKNKAISGVTGGGMPGIGLDETKIELIKSRNNLVELIDSLKLNYGYSSVGRMRDVPVYNTATILASMDSTAVNALSSPIDIEIDPAGNETYDIRVSNNFQGQQEEKTFTNAKMPLTVKMAQGDVRLTRSATASPMTLTEKIKIVNPLVTAGELGSAINIAFASNSPNILRLSVTTDLIPEGVDIVNALLVQYNRQVIEDKNRSAIQTEAFIIERLRMIHDELRDVESRMSSYQQSHGITGTPGASTAAAYTDEYAVEDQIYGTQAKLEIINTLISTINRQAEYSLIPVLVSDGALQGAIEKYNTEVGKYERLIQGKNLANPDAAVLKQREILDRAKSAILQAAMTSRNTLDHELSTYRSRVARSQSKLNAQPEVDRGLNEIFREQQVKANIYTFLLERREELALQKTLAIPTARLIDNPVGSGPVSPKPGAIYIGALLIGLLIPALVIFLRRVLFPVFRDQEELSRMTNMPILGEICSDPSCEDQIIVVGHNVSTPIAELFRLMRNNISFTGNGVDNKVILITSAISGEGKTFIATNLAMTYALSGKRTLVIGADIRRPALAHRFGLNNQQGLTTYLSGQERDFNALIHQSDSNPNLFVLPAGPIPPNPNELLLSDYMSDLMQYLRQEFDYIIIDSAPIGIVSDTFLIIPQTDIQLFVTCADFSTKKGLKVLHTAVATHKLKRVYLLLNGVNMTSGSYLYRRYGTYGRYGRGARSYGYGYRAKEADELSRNNRSNK